MNLLFKKYTINRMCDTKINLTFGAVTPKPFNYGTIRRHHD